MKNTAFPIDAFRGLETPFYYYDTELLRKTLGIIKKETERYGFCQHYAIKANANPELLKIIASYGFGADCVSGGEIEAAVVAGFDPSKIVFAGVGKTDREIETGLERGIYCFNAESLPELENINLLAGRRGVKANVTIRINPDVDAHTHEKITTGRRENKFGINAPQAAGVIKQIEKMENLRFEGVHFHIGSQITEMEVFEALCVRANEIVSQLEAHGIEVRNIDFGGGLGIDYENPAENNVAEFGKYFAVFDKNVDKKGRRLHFELGRAVVAQCGSLISRVVYVKEGEVKNFAILDAGFSDLIRPAMYDAYHLIENLTSDGPLCKYDVVGPICESSDVFGKDRMLREARRGDLIAIRSAGAYGEVMASRYNLRELPKAYYSDGING